MRSFNLAGSLVLVLAFSPVACTEDTTGQLDTPDAASEAGLVSTTESIHPRPDAAASQSGAGPSTELDTGTSTLTDASSPDTSTGPTGSADSSAGSTGSTEDASTPGASSIAASATHASPTHTNAAPSASVVTSATASEPAELMDASAPDAAEPDAAEPDANPSPTAPGVDAAQPAVTSADPVESVVVPPDAAPPAPTDTSFSLPDAATPAPACLPEYPFCTVALPVFSTGVDDNGEVLAGGSVDPHYALIQSADAMFGGPDAIVVSQIAENYWVANSSTSKWLAPSPNQAYPGADPCNASGTYVYRTSFDLTGYNLDSVLISGRWAADNQGTDIRLNGASLGITVGGYNNLASFTIGSGLVASVNTLDFEILDYGCPNGLRVELSGIGAAPLPPRL